MIADRLNQQVNIPVQIQAHIFCVLSIICWAQVLYYNQWAYSPFLDWLITTDLLPLLSLHLDSHYSWIKATLIGMGSGALMGGAEALFIFILRVGIIL